MRHQAGAGAVPGADVSETHVFTDDGAVIHGVGIRRDDGRDDEMFREGRVHVVDEMTCANK